MSYDVFLSHNSGDKPTVRAVADWLRNNGVPKIFWLDEVELLPGDRLPVTLGRAMEESRSAIVFIGPNGEGAWQSEEIDTLLNKAIKLSRQKDEFRIIPVLLPDADTSELRWFLQTRLWVDLSKGVTDSQAELMRLRQAILGKTGEPPVFDDPNFNPYKGLLAFQVADSPFFFGRAAACRQLAARVKDWRLACVVGPSGNGKSSLARAGLATDAAEAVCPGIRTWKRVVLVPGSHLLRAFLEQLHAGRPDHERADAVAHALERVEPAGRTVTAEELAEALNAEFRAWSPEPGRPILFVVDQLEELFTHRGLRTVTDVEREERIRRVLDCLALLSANGDARWRFVFTLREDFYQRCRISDAFWRLISTERLALRLDELDEPGWREAIKGPAARAGAYLEGGLVEVMLKDVYRQRGSMPLLQLTLQELWRLRQGACLTHAAYTRLGGVANALQHRASTAFRLLEHEKPEYLEIARNLFLRLTSLGEGVSDTRRRLHRSEMDWEHTNPRDIEHVVSRLSDADHRLLLANEHSLEVTHEVLIRESEHIRDWLDGAGGARKEIPILRRLTHAARQWVDNDREPEFLNAADPPSELKQWAGKTRLRLTRLEREYLNASRAQRAQQHWHRRRQQQALRSADLDKIRQAEERAKEKEMARRRAVRISLVAAALAVIAVYFGVRANQQKASAQTALVKSFYRSIGVAIRPTRDEFEALWELATLTKDNEAVRGHLLQRWSTSSDTVLRATANNSWGLRAASGLHAQLASSETMALLLLEMLENPAETDPARLSAVGQVLAALGDRIEPDRAAALMARGAAPLLREVENQANGHRGLEALTRALAALGGRMEPGPAAALGTNLVRVLKHPAFTDFARLRALGQVLAELGDRMESSPAAALSSTLFGVLESPAETDPNRLRALGLALEALGGRIDPVPAAALGTNLLRVLENPAEKDPERLNRLAQALAALGKRMERGTAAALAIRGASPLVRALENPAETDVSRLGVLGLGLVALSGRMEPGPATTMAVRGAAPLVRGLENLAETDRSRLRVMGLALGALGSRIDSGSAAAFGTNLVRALENPAENNPDRLIQLVSALAALCGRMEPLEAAELSGRGAVPIVRALENPAEEDPIRLIALGGALAALGSKMEPGSATALSTNLQRVFEKSAETNRNRLRVLGEALARLSGRMEPGPVAALSSNLLSVLENPAETNLFRQSALGQVLAALGGRMESAGASALAARGAAPLERRLQGQAETGLSALGHALAALGDRLEPGPAAVLASNLVRVLANPADTNRDRMSALGETLTVLGGRLDPGPAASLGTKLVGVLENPAETNRARLGALGQTLAALGSRLDHGPAAALGTKLLRVLQDSAETDRDRVSDLSQALAALAGRMESEPALSLAVRAAALLRRMLENTAETDPTSTDLLGKALTTLTGRLANSTANSVFAWSYRLYDPIPPPPELGAATEPRRSDFMADCETLSTSQLVEMLKWPFCVGEAEKIVLDELEKPNRLNAKFGGNLREFIQIADARPEWRQILRAPAQRPSAN